MNRCQCLGSCRLPPPRGIRFLNAPSAARRSARLRVLLLVALPCLIIAATAVPAAAVTLDALIEDNLTITQGNLLFSNFTFGRGFSAFGDPGATGTPTTPAGITVEGVTLGAAPPLFGLFGPTHGLSFTGPITASTSSSIGQAELRIRIGYDVAVLESQEVLKFLSIQTVSSAGPPPVPGAAPCVSRGCDVRVHVIVETLDGHFVSLEDVIFSSVGGVGTPPKQRTRRDRSTVGHRQL